MGHTSLNKATWRWMKISEKEIWVKLGRAGRWENEEEITTYEAQDNGRAR